VAWSPQKAVLSVPIADGSLILWDVATDQDHILGGQPGNILNIAWSTDGNFLAAGLQDGSVYIWDALEDVLLYALSYSADDPISDLSWSPDGQTLATASCFAEFTSYNNCTLVLWNPSSGEHVRSLQSGAYEITHIAWSPVGRIIRLCTYEWRRHPF
jgi:WD40 repeat protein